MRAQRVSQITSGEIEDLGEMGSFSEEKFVAGSPRGPEGPEAGQEEEGEVGQRQQKGREAPRQARTVVLVVLPGVLSLDDEIPLPSLKHVADRVRDDLY